MVDQIAMFDLPGASYATKSGNNPFFTSSTDEYATPQWLFDQLDAEFHFTLDPCSTDENAKCKKHYTREQDGLKQDWSGETVWCNPPYGKEIGAWIKRCYEHNLHGGVLRLCSFRPGQIPPFFTIISTAKRRFGSCVDVFTSTAL